MAEFIDGFHFLADLKKTVTVFGSTVMTEKDKHYQAALKFGSLIAKMVTVLSPVVGQE
jgi:predicted Rossmann-fold nucleotide-binding protein